MTEHYFVVKATKENGIVYFEVDADTTNAVFDNRPIFNVEEEEWEMVSDETSDLDSELLAALSDKL